jgi:hypothetical protein
MFQAILWVFFFDTYPREPKRVDMKSERYFRVAFEFIRFFCEKIWPSTENAAFEEFSRLYGASTDQNFMSWFKDNFLGDELAAGYFSGWDCKQMPNYGCDVDSILLSIYETIGLLSETGKLLCTENGYLGIGPPGTVPGDLICILAGCIYPVVIRRVYSHYIYIGSYFVLGLMDGEANQAVERGHLYLQEFKIH